MIWGRPYSWDSHRHILDDGSVWCSWQSRAVEVDYCLGCKAFEALIEDGPNTYLYCRPLVRPLREAQLYVSC